MRINHLIGEEKEEILNSCIRYKDIFEGEVGRQASKMLSEGIITHSMSP
jgi:hypothetical protein